MRRALPAFLLLALAGCAGGLLISESDRRRAIEDLSGQRLYLRVAARVAPFPGDGSKLLLSDGPPEETRSPDGATPSSPSTEILPPGTPVWIRAIEFPSPLAAAGRGDRGPRDHPWVHLDLPGHRRPAILPLSRGVSSFDDVRAEVDRVLELDDPTPVFLSLPRPQREAILRKEPAEGMSPRALEMAWGQPDRRTIDRPAGTEEWVWTPGNRIAFLQGERLLRWQFR